MPAAIVDDVHFPADDAGDDDCGSRLGSGARARGKRGGGEEGGLPALQSSRKRRTQLATRDPVWPAIMSAIPSCLLPVVVIAGVSVRRRLEQDAGLEIGAPRPSYMAEPADHPALRDQSRGRHRRTS